MAFAAYYYHALDWSIATNDPFLIRGLGAESCTTCSKFVSQLDGMASKGQHMRGGRAVVLGAGITSGHSKIAADVLIHVRLRQEKGEIVDARGRVTYTQPASTPAVIVLTKWASDGWDVVEISNQ